ncbi:MAG: DinB family protein [Acidobacteriota bacterium]
MAIRDALLPEYDHEMGTTRRLLERTPEAELGWKPHEKSMTLGQLAGHIANIPRWAKAVTDGSGFDVATAGDDVRPKTPASVTELLADFDRKVADARAGLAATDDPQMLEPWTLSQGDHEIFTMPRVSALRTFVLNHLIHHRGQLSVYLRLRNVAVPPIYGPTADEQ